MGTKLFVRMPKLVPVRKKSEKNRGVNADVYCRKKCPERRIDVRSRDGRRSNRLGYGKSWTRGRTMPDVSQSEAEVRKKGFLWGDSSVKGNFLRLRLHRFGWGRTA